MTYPNVCCTACYRLPPRGQRTWTIMKNCVWAKWAQITLKFFWLGKDSENAMIHGAVTKIRNDRDANTFYDAAETVTQMIEFGYIPRVRNRPWFYPDISEEELYAPISQYTRERYLREIFFMNQGKRQVARFALEQRVKQFMRSRITTLSDEDLWEEARRRESESLRELQAASSFQAVDEQGSYTRVVRGMSVPPTGTPRRRTRLELTGDYVPMDRDPTEPSVSAINVGALRAPTSGDDRYCMLDSGAVLTREKTCLPWTFSLGTAHE